MFPFVIFCILNPRFKFFGVFFFLSPHLTTLELLRVLFSPPPPPPRDPLTTLELLGSFLSFFCPLTALEPLGFCFVSLRFLFHPFLSYNNPKALRVLGCVVLLLSLFNFGAPRVFLVLFLSFSNPTALKFSCFVFFVAL